VKNAPKRPGKLSTTVHKEESMKNSIRIQTASMIAKLLHTMAEAGGLSIAEEVEIVA